MIGGAMRAGIAVVRRLSDLARDPDERRRLEEFMNSVLKEFELAGASGNGAGARGGWPQA
jgi:hypothetical protein